MQKYTEEYQELELIGRGNYGSAYLINNKRENKLYIAKKIHLNTLSDKEKHSSIQEVSLLKRLKHPNIVKFIDSFIHQDILTIIMEYCEEGDIQFHIKRKQKEKQFFEEQLVLNWFLQISMALQYMHTQKILHRDIKSSNIFLTSNGTVKIGDFGISKTLDNTNDQAQTVIGTPYYMSPEVCEGKPYTFKSDVWSLGCVLFELCSLNYAFQANNLLNLVFKIVKDKVPKIPSTYSNDLQELIEQLMTKSQMNRPSVREILQFPFIQKTMLNFIENNGVMQTNQKIPIKITQTHKQLKKQYSQSHEPMNKTDNNTEQTARQKMLKRKEMLVKAKEEQMKEAARQNILQVGVAKQMKMRNIYGNDYASQHFTSTQNPKQFQSTQNTNNPYQQTQYTYQQDQYQEQQQNYYEQYQQQYQYQNQYVNQEQTHNQQSQMQGDLMDDKTIQSMNYSKTYHQNLLHNQQHNQQMNNLNYDLSMLSFNNNTIKTELTKNITKDMIINNPYDQTQMTQNDPYDQYEDDFEEYISEDEEDQRLTNKADLQELEQVVDVYKQALHSNDVTTFTNLKQIQEDPFELSQTIDSTSQQSNSQSLGQSMIPKGLEKINSIKEKCQNEIGPVNFNKIYTFIKEEREKGTDEQTIQQGLIQMAGKNNSTICFEIDQILYLESKLG